VKNHENALAKDVKKMEKVLTGIEEKWIFISMYSNS
jgi:hypothetical protein